MSGAKHKPCWSSDTAKKRPKFDVFTLYRQLSLLPFIVTHLLLLHFSGFTNDADVSKQDILLNAVKKYIRMLRSRQFYDMKK